MEFSIRLNRKKQFKAKWRYVRILPKIFMRFKISDMN